MALLFATVALASPLCSQPAGAEALPLLAGVTVPGYAVGVSGRDGITALAAFGAAEVTADGARVRPMTVDTPVRIASISKLFVALAVHRLAEAGKLALDDDVSRHLGWRLRNPAHPTVPITIRQILRHEGSLSDAGGYGGKLGTRLRDSIGANSFSGAAPGTAFDYSNLNSAVLGEVIERATGERFDRAMRTLVLGPLELKACFNWSGCGEAQAAAGAVLYRKSPDYGETWAPAGSWVAQVDAVRPPECPVRRSEGQACDLERYVPGTHGGLFGPQGGLRISVNELERVGRFLRGDGDGLLRPETMESLFRPVATRPMGGGEESDPGLMQYWSEGGLHCFSGTGKAGGDQPAAPSRMKGCGHLGEAYGLFSALVVDRAGGTVMAWAMTGSGDKPPPGKVSRFNAMEEDIAAGLLKRLAR